MNDAFIGLLFLVCLLIGVGLGILFRSVELGGVIGLGSGLLLILLFRNKNNKR
ncbi:hypothetical protein NSA56_10945 [Oceanobacillus caeni]|uniref:hypothetical protein n=1 Tax=Bacillaceae TaxID=186817 RepID=UPI00142F097A|nr:MULTISPECIES: hypothetical protein [Bacillaceae]MBU8791263.1 hypothetical protein [Oceanobacillus caeni]MCR1834915.1 hypothetical protein [Oceanobacillus caeni]